MTDPVALEALGAWAVVEQGRCKTRFPEPECSVQPGAWVHGLPCTDCTPSSKFSALHRTFAALPGGMLVQGLVGADSAVMVAEESAAKADLAMAMVLGPTCRTPAPLPPCTRRP